MKRIVIIGAGGHGREVADIVRHQAQQAPPNETGQLLGFVDENASLHGSRIDGVPVLGGWSWFEEQAGEPVAVICALGTPALCRRIVQRAQAAGLSFANAISPLASVSPSASIGQGVMLFPYTFVSAHTRIDDHCIVNVGSTVGHDTRLGRYSNLCPGVHLAGNVAIGEGTYLGIGSCVIQGRAIGAWSVLGAGAVVIRDIPAHTTVVGVPAHAIKQSLTQRKETDI
ncbi:MAG: acetyltransferase [Blastochloris sp.]|nr:acetyltransferase [Blastochloris sp.]